jgi:hypothetical protein
VGARVDPGEMDHCIKNYLGAEIFVFWPSYFFFKEIEKFQIDAFAETIALKWLLDEVYRVLYFLRHKVGDGILEGVGLFMNHDTWSGFLDL